MPGDAQAGPHLGDVGGVDAVGAGLREQRAPALEARHHVVLIDVLNLGNLRQEDRIARVRLLQIAEELERPAGLVLVPEIDDLKLVVRLSLEKPAVVPGPEHLLQAFVAVAPGQQQQKPKDLRGCRRDVGVVAIHPDPEVGIVEPGIARERPFERVLNPLAVAGGREPLFAQHPPLHSRGVSAT